MQMSPSAYDRNESQAERYDRNLMELLQELRVAGLGVQVALRILAAAAVYQWLRKAQSRAARAVHRRPYSCRRGDGSADGSGRVSPPRVPVAPEGAAGHSG